MTAPLRPCQTVGRCSSTASQARASFQSRITVCGETPSASAVSSTLSPPKNRSSITCARRGSCCASASKASSRAQVRLARSGPGAGAHQVHRGRMIDPLHAAAAFVEARARAASTRIRRMIVRRRRRSERGPASPEPGHPPVAGTPRAPARSRRTSARPFFPGVVAPKPSQMGVHNRRQALERLVITAPPGFEQRRDVGRWRMTA